MSFPMQGKHSNCKAEEEKEGRYYEDYQVDCWLQNKDPADEKKWEKMVKQLQDRAKKRLKKIVQHAKKHKCYAHHFNT